MFVSRKKNAYFVWHSHSVMRVFICDGPGASAGVEAQQGRGHVMKSVITNSNPGFTSQTPIQPKDKLLVGIIPHKKQIHQC
jgi:hypothetical protein